MVRMGTLSGSLRLAVAVVIVMAMSPVGGAHGVPAKPEQAWNDYWTTTTGTEVPRDVAPLLDELADRVGADLPMRLMGGQQDQSGTAVGDIWSVCVSPSHGCDASGTTHNFCERFPIGQQFWLYVSVPSAVTVTASGAAVGTWTEWTFDSSGAYQEGTVTGSNCIIIDTPKVTVVYSNGAGNYT